MSIFTKVDNVNISTNIGACKITALLTPKALIVFNKNKEYVFKDKELEAIVGDLDDVCSNKGYKKKLLCRISIIDLHSLHLSGDITCPT